MSSEKKISFASPLSSSSSSSSVPLNPFEAYESFVKNYAFLITPLEDFARACTVFMPGRFSEGEVKGEALYASINVLSLYHDHILQRRRANLSDLRCGKQSHMIKRIKLLLGMTRNVQVVLEMLAKKFPIWHGKWGVVFLVEAFKAVMLLLLWRNNRRRMLITQSPERVTVLHEKQKMRRMQQQLTQEEGGQAAVEFSALRNMYTLHGRGTGHPHGAFSEHLNAAKVRNDVPGERLYQQGASFAKQISECLHILRPVIYVGAKLYWRDPASWKPWLLSLAVDALRVAAEEQDESRSQAETTEINRRRLMLLFYLLRNPLFENYLKGPLATVVAPLEKVPVIGFLFTNLLRLAFYLPGYHFYTSAS